MKLLYPTMSLVSLSGRVKTTRFRFSDLQNVRVNIKADTTIALSGNTVVDDVGNIVVDDSGNVITD